MEINLQEAITIPKELLSEVKFSRSDVLENDVTRQRLRKIYLGKAQSIGNLYKIKVKIYFTTSEREMMRVETTIWSADDQFVTVKGGAIPTHAITAIEF
jgi:hypothetical protein